ncbi:MAG TPA: heme ABC exporter ATP-binding protein CcmA [Acidimicrobiia bacterium]|nr:heme ABC exporter ATP-binding protein CcmA [Acidimicrobiia bacterium]
MNTPLINLENVGVRFGRLTVLRGIFLHVDPGEGVGIIGPNGSGKSTLLRVLATLLRPSEGTGNVLGIPLNKEPTPATRRRVALIGHHPALYGELTLEENLEFVARLAGIANGSVRQSLEKVGLGGAMDRRADHSSHGMQRRVEFARVLMTQPDLLLLDEAHAGLDKMATRLVEATVNDVKRRGGSVVLVSHEPDRMLPLVARTYELVGGTAVESLT